MPLVNSLHKLTKLLNTIAVLDEQALPRAQSLSSRLNFDIVDIDNTKPQLWVSQDALSLNMPALGKPFMIDFSAGKYDHRRKFGGGRGQPLAKAIGLKQGQTPTVIDATAGFARDAFVLASLGCQVTMLEQNAVMAALVGDAINRAAEDEAIKDIAQRLQIIHSNAITYLSENFISAEVIYLDPMYPSRDKSALVKKEMQLLHQLVGADTNGKELLEIARQKATKRVVVKRPKGAEYLGEQKPSASVQSKNTRFDLYPTA